MTMDVKDLLKAARALPPDEQLELLQGLAQSLAQAFSPLAQSTAEFWMHRSIEDIARERQIPVVTDLHALAMQGWPSDEAADDLISYVQNQRRADREQ